MGRYFAPCKICIPHILVGYAGGRAMQEQEQLPDPMPWIVSQNPSMGPGFRHKSVWNGFAFIQRVSGRIA